MPPLSPLHDFDVEGELRRLQALEAEPFWQRALRHVPLGVAGLPYAQSKQVLESKPVKAATSLFAGTSNLVGLEAEELLSRLTGGEHGGEFGLTEAGKKQYLEDTEATLGGVTYKDPEKGPEAFDLLGDTYQTKGAGEVAARGYRLAGELAAEKGLEALGARIPEAVQAYDPEAPSGLRDVSGRLPGGQAAVAAGGEAATGFLLDLPFDPAELRVAKSQSALAAAERALEAADAIGESARVHARARAGYLAAEGADTASAALALPGTIGATHESLQSTLSLLDEKGLAHPETAQALVNTVLSGAFGASMAGSLHRPQPHPISTADRVAQIRAARSAKQEAVRAGLRPMLDDLLAQGRHQQLIGTGTAMLPGPADPPPMAPMPQAEEGQDPLAAAAALPQAPEPLPQPDFTEAFDADIAAGPEPAFQPGEPGPTDPLAREGPGEVAPGDPADPTQVGRGELGEVLLEPSQPGQQLFFDDEPGEPAELELVAPEAPLPGQGIPEAAAPAEEPAQAAGGGADGTVPGGPGAVVPGGGGGEDFAGVVQAQDQEGGGEPGPGDQEAGQDPGGVGGIGDAGDAGKGLKWIGVGEDAYAEVQGTPVNVWKTVGGTYSAIVDGATIGGPGHTYPTKAVAQKAAELSLKLKTQMKAGATAAPTLDPDADEPTSGWELADHDYPGDVYKTIGKKEYGIHEDAEGGYKITQNGLPVDDYYSSFKEAAEAATNLAQGKPALPNSQPTQGAGATPETPVDSPPADPGAAPAPFAPKLPEQDTSGITWTSSPYMEEGKSIDGYSYQHTGKLGKATFALGEFPNGEVDVWFASGPGKMDHLGAPASMEAALQLAQKHAEDLGLLQVVLGQPGQPAPAKPKATAGPAGPAPTQASLTQISGQSGGNPGGLYRDPQGRQFYVKPASPSHVANEVLANRLYSAAGLLVPEVHAIDWAGDSASPRAVASSIIPDLSPVKGSYDPAPSDAWEGFGMDAWLANWDVVGLLAGKSSGNLYTNPQGKTVRLDQGGALLYRGMGQPKGGKFGPEVTELEGLRDPSKNPTAAKVFEGMTTKQVYDSLKRVSDLSPEKIGELVQEFGPKDGPEAAGLLSTLLARQKYIQGKMGELAKELAGGKKSYPMQSAHFHTKLESWLEEKGLDVKTMPAAEYKRLSEELMKAYDPNVNTMLWGDKPNLPSWMTSQAEAVQKESAHYSSQKEVKEAMKAPGVDQDFLKKVLAYKKQVAETANLRAWFKKKLKEKSFKGWWRNSKAVDNHGLPLPLYHGTAHIFGEFDPSKLGTAHADPNDYFGFYFSPSRNVASGLGGGKTLAGMLSIQKPYVVTVDQMAHFQFPGNTPGNSYPNKAQVLKMKQAMMDLGYDGIRVVGSKSSTPGGEWYWDQWVPFSSNQIHAITHPSFGKQSAEVKAFKEGLAALKKAGGVVPLLDTPEIVAAAREKLKHSLATQQGEGLQTAVMNDLGSAIYQALRQGPKTLRDVVRWVGKSFGQLISSVPQLGKLIRQAYSQAMDRARPLVAAFEQAGRDLMDPNQAFGGLPLPFSPAPISPPAGIPLQGPPPPAPSPASATKVSLEDKAATARAGPALDLPPKPPATGKPGGTPDIAPNLERMGLDEESTQRMRALLEEMGKLPQGKGALDRAQPEHWADLDHTITHLLRVRGADDWRRIAKTRNLRAAEVQAFKTLVTENAVSADAARRRAEHFLLQGDQTQADKAGASYLAHKLQLVANLRAFANDGTAAARALTARRRVMQGRTDMEKAVSVVFRTLGSEKAEALSDPEVASLATLVQETIAGTRSDDSLQNALLEALRPTTWDKLMEAWKAGLLSGIPTKIANNLGNATNLVLDIIKDPVAGAWDWGRHLGPHASGKARTRYVSDTGAALAGLKSALPHAFRQWWSDWTDATLYRPEKLENLSLDEGLGSLLPAIGPGPEALRSAMRAVGIKDFNLGRFVRSPFRKLQAADNLFKHLFRSMETHREANRLVERWIEQGKVPRGDKARVLSATLGDIYSPNGPSRYAKLLAKAEAAATAGTFQTKPGPTGQTIEAVFRSPIGKYLNIFAPFRRTPLNIGKATLKLTPAGLVIAGARMLGKEGGKLRGKRSDEQLIDDMARALVGTLISTLLVAAARAGHVTGSGPVDDDERKLLLNTGWQPNSLVVEVDGRKHYIPMNRFEPIGTLFGIAGDIADTWKAKNSKELFQKLAGIVIDQGLNKTYFEGINNALELFSDPQRYGQSVARSVGGSLVPTLVASTARAVDPIYRDTAGDGVLENVVRTIQARLPGLSQALPAKRTATGGPAERPGNFVSRLALPTTISPEKRGREVEKELLRIGYAPGPPKREVTIKGRSYRLNDREYRELFRGREEAAQEVRDLLGSDDYLSLPDTVEEGGNQSKEGMVRRIYLRRLAEARKRAFALRLQDETEDADFLPRVRFGG